MVGSQKHAEQKKADTQAYVPYLCEVKGKKLVYSDRNQVSSCMGWENWLVRRTVEHFLVTETFLHVMQEVVTQKCIIHLSKFIKLYT